MAPGRYSEKLPGTDEVYRDPRCKMSSISSHHHTRSAFRAEHRRYLACPTRHPRRGAYCRPRSSLRHTRLNTWQWLAPGGSVAVQIRAYYYGNRSIGRKPLGEIYYRINYMESMLVHFLGAYNILLYLSRERRFRVHTFFWYASLRG